MMHICLRSERKLKFLTFRSTIIATISITFPDSTNYQMTRYDVTVFNFLWIADCCIMRTFIMRIIRIFFFEKYVRIFTYFILSYAYPRTLDQGQHPEGRIALFQRTERLGKTQLSHGWLRCTPPLRTAKSPPISSAYDRLHSLS